MANFEFNTFVKGLVTDVNPLTFPENTSLDELNFVLNKDGSRQRRLGLVYDNTQATSVSSQEGYSQSYLWKNVNSTGLSIFVVQFGLSIFFHKVDETGVLPYFAEIDYSGVLTGNYGNPSEYRLSFSSGFGKLFVAGKHTNPFWCELDTETDEIDFGAISISTRDLDGVEDGFLPDYKPTTSDINVEHLYNLSNQGWGDSSTFTSSIDKIKSGQRYSLLFVSKVGSTSGGANKAQTYLNATSRYPANNQIWTIGKDAEDIFQPALLDKMDFGTSFAPRGRNVINPFNQQRNGLPTRVERSRPDSIAFFAGRVFYAGIDAENSATNLTTGHVFFSQVVSDINRAGRCFQQADPTSEHISDIIEDDGGVIPISGCGKIQSMVSLSASLVIIADNGIWEITGVDAPFSATQYAINKISEFGAITPDFVSYEGSVFFLSEKDVMTVTYSEQGGLVTRSMTENVINRYYRTIPTPCKLEAKLTFDPSDKTMMVIHGMDANLPKRRTELLAHDFTLGAWFKHSYNLEPDTSISSVTYINEAISKTIIEDVLVGTAPVLVGDSQVTVIDTFALNSKPELRFMICDCDSYRFAYMGSDTFLDFEERPYDSYLVTGVNTFQDTMRNKQIEYIVVTLKRTEELIGDTVEKESSCLLSTRWDFSDSAVSNKWSKPQQVYRYTRFFIPEQGADFGYGHNVIQTKNKVRGTGKALSFVFESEPGKDLHLYGWAVSLNGRRSV